MRLLRYIYEPTGSGGVSQRKRVVEEYYELFNRQDWHGMLRLVTDDVERHEVGAPERIRGKLAFEQHMAPGPEVASLRGDITRMTEEDGVVVAEVSVRLTKKDGGSLNIQACTIFEFEGEKIKRLTAFATVV